MALPSWSQRSPPADASGWTRSSPLGFATSRSLTHHCAPDGHCSHGDVFLRFRVVGREGPFTLTIPSFYIRSQPYMARTDTVLLTTMNKSAPSPSGSRHARSPDARRRIRLPSRKAILRTKEWLPSKIKKFAYSTLHRNAFVVTFCIRCSRGSRTGPWASSHAWTGLFLNEILGEARLMYVAEIADADTSVCFFHQIAGSLTAVWGTGRPSRRQFRPNHAYQLLNSLFIRF